MSRLLTGIDKEQVREAIKEAERHTRGELITVITPRSDEYLFIPTLWAGLVALMMPALMLLLNTEQETMMVFISQIAVFVTCTIVFQFPLIKYALVPKSIKRLRASRLAREQFFMQGLHHTKERTGILIFVSIAEHYVEIIADKGINDVVPNGTWDTVVNDFVGEVKSEHYTQGFIKAITSCGAILSESFPADIENVNELPNHLIELDF